MPKNNLLGSPRMELISEKNQMKSFLFAMTKRKITTVLCVLLCSLGLLVFLAASAYSFRYEDLGLAASSFDEDLEDKILRDYTEEDRILRERFKDVYYFSPDEPHQLPDLEDKIAEYVSKLSGEYGVYSYNISTGETVGYGHNDYFTMASLSKLFASTAEISKRNDRANFDSIRKMMKSSDNDAFARMVSGLGVEYIEKHIDELGLIGVDFVDNNATPRGVGEYLKMLYDGRVVKRDFSKRMLEYMQDTTNEDRIPALLPDEARVYHKVGTWQGSYSDAGIVSYSGGDYIVVLMTDNSSYLQGTVFMQDVSKMIYEFWQIRRPI